MSEPDNLQNNAVPDDKTAHIFFAADGRDADIVRLKAELEEDLRDARLLQRVGLELLEQDRAERSYQKIADAAVALMRGKCASIHLYLTSPNSSARFQLMALSGFPANDEDAKKWLAEISESTCEAARRAGRRVVISDISKYEPAESVKVLPGLISAFQSTPLYSRTGKLVGMLSTYWTDSHTPGERQLELLDTLARQAADFVERDQTLQALKESEARLRALATATSDELYRVSADWSQMYQLDGSTFLADTGEPIGNWLEKYIAPEDQRRVKQEIQAAIERKGTFQVEHRVLRADGSLGWTFSRAVPILDRDGNIVEWFGTATDVTERKRGEEALVKERDESDKRKRLYEAITSSTPDLIYVFDLNYRFTYANEALLKMWGRSWDESIGKGLRDLGYEEWHAAMHEREIDQVVKTKQSIRGEVFFPHATLGRRSYDYIFVPVLQPSGEVEAVAGTTRDITELKLAELALRESEAKFRRFYESNMLPIAFWTVQGHVYESNQAFADLVGYTRDEIAAGDFNWIERIVPEYRLLHEEGVRMAIEHEVFVDPYELELLRKDGQKISVVVGYTMLEGSREKGLTFVLDISEQKSLMTQLEKRVEERTRELQRSNEDLQQFAHVASHDLKEPVRKIKTFGYRLQEELAKTADERPKVYLQKVLASAERMSLMIDGVLAYSALGATERKIQQVDLNKILSHIKDDLEVLIQQKDATIDCDTLPVIDGVHVLIHQLFYNLINNSLKFSRQNERPLINVSSQIISRDGEAFAQVELLDNGIGFEPEYNEKIFDTFTRLHSRDKYEGTGLGLSLCRKIVERHHGRISASGRKGVGARFTILLPLKQPLP